MSDTVSKVLSANVPLGGFVYIDYLADRIASDYNTGVHTVSTSDGFSYTTDSNKVSVYLNATNIRITNNTGFVWPAGLTVSAILQTKRIGGSTTGTTAGSSAVVSRTVTGSGAVTMTAADQTVVINKTVGEATAVAGPPPTSPGSIYSVVDGKGDADVNPITITFSNGDTYVIDTELGSVDFWYESASSKWRIKCTNS